MYGYTMHVPAPIEMYHRLHQAVLEVIDEHGGADGLLLHLAYPVRDGFDLTELWETKEEFDAFNRDIFAKAAERAGVPMEEPQPPQVEFTPAGLTTPRVFSTDADR